MADLRTRLSPSGRAGLWALALGVSGVILALGADAVALFGQQEDDYSDPTSHPSYYESGPHLEGYRFTELPLDPDSPWYPSSASTRSGDFYSQAQLMDVERCGDLSCHPDIYDMWFESTHHLASMSDPWYRRSVQFIQERTDVKTSQWCAGCHDPALMMTGKMQAGEEIDFDSAAANIGISCQFCHSVDRVHPALANGSFRLAPAAALPNAGTTDPELRAAGNAELLADPDLIRRHSSRRRSTFHGLSQFCATCHKQSLITPVNNYKWFRGFDEYDGWQNSGVSGASVRSFYFPENPLQCQDCHMPEVASTDAGNDDGFVASHRFVGSNTALPALHGYTKQLEETAAFLQADQVTVDIFALDVVRGDAATRVAPIADQELALPAGTEVRAEIVVRTRGVGHQFTGGTTDSNMSWLEVTLLDGNGQPVLMSGGMAEDRFIEEAAHSYRGIFLDEAGQVIDKRNGWDRRTPVYVRFIPPGAADTAHYSFTVPAEVQGPLTLRARLNYRKHKQSYNRWAMGATPSIEQPADAVSLPAVDTRVWDYDDSLVPELPVVVLDETSVTFAESAESPTVNGESLIRDLIGEAPSDAMRFNDYGIGLLRQGDLRAALSQFRHVQRLAPDYADAFVNEARVHLQEGNLVQAETALQSALAIEPGFGKANYFLAQVARGFGEYARAAELLEGVVEDYAYDRAVQIDLGNTYYLTRRYEDAIEPLLFVINQIDPEELGAHYNLMLAYRAMGETEKAEIHESRYLRYREDEDIRQLTGPFKRDNPVINREAQSIHSHVLMPPGARFSAADRFPFTEWLEGGRYWRAPVEYAGPLPPWRRPDRPATKAGGEQ
ncbi:MAG: tetratricopeptide repeat protein [Acidobacteria bacterium]|nr:tetratricopeptide repeat protein [Acidobacteriota bacterium]